MTGIRTPNLPAASTLENVLGNQTVDGIIRTRLTAIDDFAIQISDALAAQPTVSIPSDYPTLQDAIDALSGRPLAAGTTITLNIEAGHAPTNGVHVANGDFSRFVITADDALVTLDASFPNNRCFILADYAAAPVLGCRIDMDSRGDNGYFLNNRSSGYVLEGHGIDNAGGLNGAAYSDADQSGNGLFVSRSSVVAARTCVFNGHKRNLWCTHESLAFCDHGNFNGATADANIYVARGSAAGLSYITATGGTGNGLRVRRARAVAMQSDLSNNGTGGQGYGCLATEKAIVNLSQGGLADNNGANLSGNAQGAINADASQVMAMNSDCRQSGGSSVIAANGGSVIVSGADIGGADGLNQAVNGVIVRTGAKVIAENATVDHCSGPGVNVTGAGADVDAPGITIQNCSRGGDINNLARFSGTGGLIQNNTNEGVRARAGAVADVSSGTVANNGAGEDLEIFNGGQIIADGTTTTNGVGTPSTADCNVAAFDTVTAGKGIIWS